MQLPWPQHESPGVNEMPSPEIEEFAKLLVRAVRDAAIESCDNLLLPQAKGPAAKRWKALKASHEDLRVVAADAVDRAIFRLLYAIDEGLLPLKFVGSNGKEIDLVEDGMSELAGWYMGSEGWRAMFSEQRWVDDVGPA
jgi:hypothetical protein